jgi:hypothetical protein
MKHTIAGFEDREPSGKKPVTKARKDAAREATEKFASTRRKLDDALAERELEKSIKEIWE